MRLMLAVDIDEDNPLPLVHEAVLWARRTEATLDLAHVGTSAWALGTAADPEVRRLLERELTRARQAEKGRLRALLDEVPAELRGEPLLLEGPPVQALVEASEDHDALLVGTHGRKGLQRFWLGSISEQLVRRAVCPVLVLRLRQDHG